MMSAAPSPQSYWTPQSVHVGLHKKTFLVFTFCSKQFTCSERVPLFSQFSVFFTESANVVHSLNQIWGKIPPKDISVFPPDINHFLDLFTIKTRTRIQPPGDTTSTQRGATSGENSEKNASKTTAQSNNFSRFSVMSCMH